MISVVIVGFGNVGQHLYRAFKNAIDVDVVQVFSRSKLDNTEDIAITHDLNDLAKADLYIIAVPDDAIAEVSGQLPFKDRLVTHTSGSVAMKALSNSNRKGVFYPLQTFSKDHEVDFKEIPICFEAQENQDAELLESLGEMISEKVVQIPSEERAQLHLAAVFVNNFTNHLYHLSEAYLTENGVDFDLLKPLIKETARKIEGLSPNDAQTGPAKRDDKMTIAKHLDLLKNDYYKKIYKTLTQSISRTHGKKL